MIFHPQRIVHATTEQEIDAALETADQVIVEGDDQLLSYAVNKAAADPHNKITVEAGEEQITIGWLPTWSWWSQRLPTWWGWYSRGSPKQLRSTFFFILNTFFLFLLLSLAGFSAYQLTIGGSPRGPLPTPGSSPEDTLRLVQTLVWPVVATVAIVALYLIARQLIGGGRLRRSRARW